jgi:16S rRNA (adenine1518-N6/adenine1519-N6)-dimethyltransferase
MQTLKEIRRLLEERNLAPQKQFGQNFLIDGNLMQRLLELADLKGGETVLEIGPATGSLTEELLSRAERVAAVEIDRGLYELLRERFAGNEKLTLLCRDSLSSKHEIAPEVLAAVSPEAHLVANLPYNIATPLLMDCLLSSWRALKGLDPAAVKFSRLTFTVQAEVCERFSASEGSGQYGPVSILRAILGKITVGPKIPASAFWPRPNVESRAARIDFDAAAAGKLVDAALLRSILTMAFGQRRKQIGSSARRSDAGIDPAAFARALEQAQIDPRLRAEDVEPQKYLELTNRLAAGKTA